MQITLGSNALRAQSEPCVRPGKGAPILRINFPSITRETSVISAVMMTNPQKKPEPLRTRVALMVISGS